MRSSGRANGPWTLRCSTTRVATLIPIRGRNAICAAEAWLMLTFPPDADAGEVSPWTVAAARTRSRARSPGRDVVNGRIDIFESPSIREWVSSGSCEGSKRGTDFESVSSSSLRSGVLHRHLLRVFSARVNREKRAVARRRDESLIRKALRRFDLPDESTKA